MITHLKERSRFAKVTLLLSLSIIGLQPDPGLSPGDKSAQHRFEFGAGSGEQRGVRLFDILRLDRDPDRG